LCFHADFTSLSHSATGNNFSHTESVKYCNVDKYFFELQCSAAYTGADATKKQTATADHALIVFTQL